ncbi:MAG: hypothetical protein EWM51_09870 [Treponema sp.]|nr:MAG: hypothetical protein EWM51_09870 [Treponema sp.]HPX47825.1 hypothetical protein [Treponemataceae bacterium]
MCWKCGKAITDTPPFSRDAVCVSCDADIRSCMNCRFYAPGSWHDCAERVEDAVRQKDRANFCDLFQLNPAYKSDHAPRGGAGSPDRTGSQNDTRTAFDQLFKS